MNLHIVHICVISVQCGWSNDLVLPQYSCFTKWLLYFTVDEQMPFKISSLTKLPIALDTGDILFSDMGCHVTIQISSLIKWLLAFWAKMYLFPTLCEQMPRHFTLGFGWIGNIKHHGVCPTEWSENIPLLYVIFHVYKYSMVGIRRWQNPNCYHYCRHPTMVGFWLVGICWIAIIIMISIYS